MKVKTIHYYDFHSEPYGRYFKEGDGKNSRGEDTSGEGFRENFLVPALNNEEIDKVVVDLTGYNRYGRSFIDEAFGGLIYKSKIPSSKIEKKLIYKHDNLSLIENLVYERLKSAKEKVEKDNG